MMSHLNDDQGKELMSIYPTCQILKEHGISFPPYAYKFELIVKYGELPQLIFYTQNIDTRLMSRVCSWRGDEHYMETNQKLAEAFGIPNCTEFTISASVDAEKEGDRGYVVTATTQHYVSVDTFTELAKVMKEN